MLRRFLLVALPILLSLPTSAQTAPALSTTSEEVVVTGSRAGRPADKSTTKVTVIDSSAIARHNDLGQLLNEQAGVFINGIYSSPAQNRSLFLRNGGNQFILILLDGQPLIDPSALDQTVDIRQLDLAGIDRIEIVRGAQSLIYGSNAVAGVINLITKKDRSGESLSVVANAAYGSWNTFEGGLSAAESSENFDYRFSYHLYSTQGFSAAAFPEDGSGTFDDDGATRHSVAGAITLRPAEGLSIRPTLRYTDYAYDYDASAFGDGDLSASLQLIAPSVAVDYQDEKITLGGRYNYVAANRYFPGGFTEKFRGRVNQADAFAVKRINNLALTLGAQLRTEELKLGIDTVANPDATTASPYAQLLLDATDDLTLEAGLRYNDHDQFGGQMNYSLGVGYQLGKFLRTTLSTASAFRNPTLDELYGPFGANAELAPQVSQSYELGLTYGNSDAGFSAGVTSFQRNVEEVIIFDGASFSYRNGGTLRDRGMELEAKAQLGKRLTASGNLTYVKARQSNVDANQERTEVENFFRRPRTSGFLGVTYAAPASLLVRLSGNYSAERPDLFFNEDFTSTVINLEPYLIVNLYGEYKLLSEKQLTVFGEVRNITDSAYVEVAGFTTQGINFRTGFRINIL